MKQEQTIGVVGNRYQLLYALEEGKALEIKTFADTLLQQLSQQLLQPQSAWSQGAA